MSILDGAKMKVLILFTLPPLILPERRLAAELNLSDAARGFANALCWAELRGVRGEPQEILAALEAVRPDVVVNLCEAPLGRPDLEAHVASLLEWCGIRFTGCGSQTLALCRRKDRTKAILQAAGVPVPNSFGLPCIVKPVDQDGSVGIDGNSVCDNPQAAEQARSRIEGESLVEEYVCGREFVVSLWGPRCPEYVSLCEVLLEEGLQVLTYQAKWDENSLDFSRISLDYRPRIENHLRVDLIEVARRAWRAVGARGYLRVDLRWNEDCGLRVIDVNPNPEVTPGLGGMYRSVTEAGWSWESFVKCQVEWS